MLKEGIRIRWEKWYPNAERDIRIRLMAIRILKESIRILYNWKAKTAKEQQLKLNKISLILRQILGEQSQISLRMI